MRTEHCHAATVLKTILLGHFIAIIASIVIIRIIQSLSIKCSTIITSDIVIITVFSYIFLYFSITYLQIFQPTSCRELLERIEGLQSLIIQEGITLVRTSY